MLHKSLHVERSDKSSPGEILGDPTPSLGIAVLFVHVLWTMASLLNLDVWPMVTWSRTQLGCLKPLL
ncbi:hypothetical protein J3F84DRAFT_367204 [Trichoderma pleuroticola]